MIKKMASFRLEAGTAEMIQALIIKFKRTQGVTLSQAAIVEIALYRLAKSMLKDNHPQL